jgi:hypothetical protein
MKTHDDDRGASLWVSWRSSLEIRANQKHVCGSNRVVEGKETHMESGIEVDG